MSFVRRLPPIIRQSRHNATRSGLALTVCRQVNDRVSPLGQLRQRAYTQNAALPAVSVQGTPQHRPTTIGTTHRDASIAARLELLLRDLASVIEQDVGGNDTWVRRLRGVLLDLEGGRRKRIGVIGDQLAMPDALVSALLQDPLSESSKARDALLSRRQDGPGTVFEISYNASTILTPGHLGLASSWLQSSGCDIVELQPTDSASMINNALSVDAVVVVIDPYRLWAGIYLQRLQPILVGGRPLVIVVNGRLPENVRSASVEASIFESLKAAGVEPSSVAVHLVDSSLASKALDALSEGLQRAEATPSTRSRAFETFQHAYLQSNIGSLQTSLADLVPNDFRYRTALSTASLATTEMSATTASDLQILQSAHNTVDDLREMSRHAVSHVRNTSVINRGIEGGLIEGGVDDEIARSRQEIAHLFKGRFSWTSMIFRLRIDDIGGEMASHITQRFGKGLERQIIFETGQLSRVQSEIDKQADEALRRLSAASISSDVHPLASPILRNHLSTLSLAIPSFTPETLLAPLDRRRLQLVEMSVGRLQREARKAALLTTTLGLGGIFASWWIYVPPVAMTSAATAVGLGLLSVVAVVVLGQRMWYKAQQTFWKEWSRSTGMLRGDLQDAFRSVVDTRVVVKATAAAEGLEKLIARRRDRIGVVESKLSDLQRRAEDLKDQL